MIVLGVILLIIGVIFALKILWVLGVIAVVVGAVFVLASAVGHAIGGRRHIY